jgi:hypothetical protein
MRLSFLVATSVAMASYFVRQLSIPSLSVKTIMAQHSPKKKKYVFRWIIEFCLMTTGFPIKTLAIQKFMTKNG